MQLKKISFSITTKCVNGFPPLASVILLNALSFSKTLDFRRRKNIYVFLEKSFVKVMRYLDPPNDMCFNNPHTWAWILNSFCLLVLIVFFLIQSLCCFPSMHTSQVLIMTKM
jgi:hypothetical protein